MSFLRLTLFLVSTALFFAGCGEKKKDWLDQEQYEQEDIFDTDQYKEKPIKGPKSPKSEK